MESLDSVTGSTEGPVPNTEYRESVGDPRVARGEEGILDLTQDTLRYYDELYDKRRELADDVKADSGECEFTLGQSLRLTWVAAQRADKALMPMFVSKHLEDGY